MIKKLFIILLIISFIFIFSSCKNTTLVEKETSSKTMTVQETTTAEADETSKTPETTEKTEEEAPAEEITEEEIKKEFSPSIIGNISIFGFPYNVYVEEDYAYIAGMGVNIIDIKDKENPKMIGIHRSNAWWRAGFFVEGNFAYFPNENIDSNGNFSEGNFQIIDLSVKNSPVVTGTVKSEGRIKDIWVIEDYAYITYEIFNKKSGIQIIDVSDKKNPMTVSIYDTGNASISSIRIDGNYLYVLVGENIKIIDIQDRENITDLGSYPISKTTLDFYVEGNYLFLPFDNSLQIIDISDEENPIMASDILASGEVTDVFIDDNNAFITYATRDSEGQVEKSGMQIIDVEDKNNSFLITELEIPGQAMAIFINGDYAYVGAGPELGLQIIKLFKG